MSTPFLLKASFSIMTAVVLSACSTSQQSNTSDNPVLTQKSLNPHFSEVLEHTEWLAEEYRIYRSKHGNKAFAVYWDDHGIPRASGFGDDKLSMELARKEALRLCQAYIRNQVTGCRIEDEEMTNRAPLNANQYPKEVIAYRDAAHWKTYLAASGHKAIAGNLSGVLGGAQGNSQSEAEEQALEQCQQHTHFSMPTCYIIASQ